MNRDQVAGFLAWLQVQLDDDELVAHGAAPGPWVYQDIDSVGGGRVCDPTVAVAHVEYDADRVDPRIRRPVFAEEADSTGEHIARHHPRRVLREVESMRALIRWYQDASSYPPSPAAHVRGEETGYAEACLDVLRHRAEASYGDRDGWQAGWRL